jgi:hypothetical protein
VLEASPEERTAVLRRADFLFERGSDDDARRARTVYLLLRADIDPADEEGDRRVTRVFESDDTRGPEMRYLAQRTMERGFEDTRAHARIVLAQCAADESDLETAERLLVETYACIQGRFEHLTFLTLMSLGVVYRRQVREVEALLVARRLEEMARLAADPLLRMRALASLFAALYALDDLPGMESTVLTAEAELERSGVNPDARWAWTARRVEVDIRKERYDEAARGLAAMALMDSRPGPGSPEVHLPAFLEARLHFEAGRPMEAKRVATDALTSGKCAPQLELRLLWIEMRATMETDGLEKALPMARSMLEGVTRTPPTVIGYGLRLRFGSLLGVLFRDRFDEPADARDAFALAAEAALQRLVEIHRCTRNLPDLKVAGSGDAELLADFHERLVHSQAEISHALTELLGNPGAAMEALDIVDGLFVTCAWCRRVRSQDLLWLPVEKFLPTATKFRVTHGICPDCSAALVG